MTTGNHPTASPFTNEQRRALVEVYRFLISLNVHGSQDSKKPLGTTDKHIEEIIKESPIKEKTEVPTNVSSMITHPRNGEPTFSQKDAHRTKFIKNNSDKVLPENSHHPAVFPDA